LNLKNVVENAVFEKNCSFVSKGGSTYELWLDKLPSTNETIFPIRAAFAAKQARAKVFRLKPGYRDHTDVRPGQYVQMF
jgi:hypothetical protein